LRPYCKSFSFNLRGLGIRALHASLTPQSAFDIMMWRSALSLSLSDARFLSLPVAIPALLMASTSETAAARAWRLSLAAQYVIHADACKSAVRQGLGFTVRRHDGSFVCWCSFNYTALQTFLDFRDVECGVSINLLEFAIAVFSVYTFVRDVLPSQPRLDVTLTQVFLWTDNSAALSWIAKRRARAPVHGFLLQVLSHALLSSRVILSAGHIPGAQNQWADAASRNFDCQDGAQLQADLVPFPRIAVSSSLLNATVQMSKLRSSATSQIALCAHTLLVSGHG
jgi:hypothetical protein